MSISKEKKIKMFKDMVRIREFEDRAQQIYREGKLNGHLQTCQGQEAVAVGAARALSKKDIIFSNHRGHGHYLARGTPAKKIMAEFYGKVTGTNHGKSGGMYLVDVERGTMVASGIVGGNICLATGSALASQIRKDKVVTLSFFGDGATNLGLFHEGLNMAALWSLPVVFICENNQYAEATKREEHQKIEKISDRASSYGMPGVTIDGTDAIKVYETVKKAVERARTGEGPTLIECVVYRLAGHSAGDLGAYRPKEEEKKWREIHDPVKIFQTQLLTKGILSKAEVERILKESREEVKEAVQFAEESEEPLAKMAYQHVYQEGINA
jgi:TPP-dependent pyruvate/acetoin dehydrogenase alpha subunit